MRLSIGISENSDICYNGYMFHVFELLSHSGGSRQTTHSDAEMRSLGLRCQPTTNPLVRIF